MRGMLVYDSSFSPIRMANTSEAIDHLNLPPLSLEDHAETVSY